MRLRRPSHTTVVAYLALLVALSSGAYAATKLGSKQIKDNSIKSVDLKNGRAVGAHDFVGGAVGDMNSRLQASCDEGVCVQTPIRLRRRSHILAIASGGEQTLEPPNGPSSAQVQCSIQLAGHAKVFAGTQHSFGEAASINTSGSQPSGFALSDVSRKAVAPGKYKIQLFCNNAGARVIGPTLTALAISGS